MQNCRGNNGANMKGRHSGVQARISVKIFNQKDTEQLIQYLFSLSFKIYTSFFLASTKRWNILKITFKMKYS